MEELVAVLPTAEFLSTFFPETSTVPGMALDRVQEDLSGLHITES